MTKPQNLYFIDTDPHGDTDGAEKAWLAVVAENEAQAKTKAWNSRLLKLITDNDEEAIKTAMDKLGDDKQLADIGGNAEVAKWLGMEESDVEAELDDMGYDSIPRADGEEVELVVLGSGELNTAGINEAFQECLANGGLASGR